MQLEKLRQQLVEVIEDVEHANREIMVVLGYIESYRQMTPFNFENIDEELR